MRLSLCERKFARATLKWSRTVLCSCVHSDNYRRFLSYALYASSGFSFSERRTFFLFFFPVFLLFNNMKSKFRSLLISVHHFKLILLSNLTKERDNLSPHLCKIWRIRYGIVQFQCHSGRLKLRPEAPGIFCIFI